MFLILLVISEIKTQYPVISQKKLQVTSLLSSTYEPFIEFLF